MSWPDQIEVWSGILSRKPLKNASLKTVTELEEAIRCFVEHNNPLFAHPFKRNTASRAARQCTAISKLGTQEPTQYLAGRMLLARQRRCQGDTLLNGAIVAAAGHASACGRPATYPIASDTALSTPGLTALAPPTT